MSSVSEGYRNVIRYSIMRVRAVWIPFNCPTILYSQWFSLMSHFFGGFPSVFSTIFREDAISFPDAGKLWLHLLNGKWHSQLTLPLIHNWFREFEKHNPWFWIIASFHYSVMKISASPVTSLILTHPSSTISSDLLAPRSDNSHVDNCRGDPKRGTR
ncbi:hypothetical protein BKA60DRAFT_40883 [Fusarium oxysporum]|nr:hypothetical protein BKA60DRAFT_40883 [Fusarium oxysporum]